MQRYSWIILTIVLVLFVIGCSSHNGPSLTQPEETVKVGTSDPSHQLWGLFQFVADPEAGTLDVIPLRIADIHLNALPFLEPPALLNLTLETLEFNGNIIDADIGLRHPFLGLTEFTGFDVCGVFISNGSVTGFSDTSIRMAGDGDTRLLNADGFSRWWNPDEFPVNDGSIFSYQDGLLGAPDSFADYNCTVNGYKYFCDDLDDADDPMDDVTLANRGMFAAGQKNVRHYTIELGNEGLVFNYAIDASWISPEGDPPWTAPDDFPIEANRPEAYRVSIQELENSLHYVNPSTFGGDLSLLIDVYDWSGPGLNTVAMECPSVFTEVSSATPIDGGPGYSTYQLDITGAAPSSDGPIDVLISVIDPTMDYQGFLPGEYITAYFIHVADVSDVAGPQATVTAIDPEWGWQEDTYEDVTITGMDFDTDCEVKLEFDPGDVIDSTNVDVIDENTIEVDFDFTGATLGLYDVKVINPGVTAGVLEDGFEVKEKTQMWLISQGDPGHTGSVGLNGPSGVLSSPSWTSDYTPEGGNALGVFLSDDTAFFSATGHTWYALPAVAVNLSDGSTKWETTLHDNPGDWTNVKGVSEDGSVVLVCESSTSTIAGLDADDGSVLWQASGSISADAYVTYDQNGNFILPLANGYRSVDADTGSMNWQTSSGGGGHSVPAIGPDGTIYGLTGGSFYAGYLHAFDPGTGAEKWSSFPYIGSSTTCGVTVSDDGKIFVYGPNGFFCYTDSGTAPVLQWQQSYSMNWYGSAGVDPNGNVIFFDGGGILRRLDPDTGATIDSSGGWEDYGTRPAIGQDGTIYCNNGYYIRCFNSDLSLRWEYYGYVGGYFSAVAIGQDETIYSGKRQQGLYAWSD